MKNLLAFCLMLCLVACTGNDPISNYVDLGLTSGNLWKKTNEINPLDNSEYFKGEDFDEKIPEYEDFRLYPDSYDWKELWEECEWTWTGTGYTIIGPNGNAITLPALGERLEDGTIAKKDTQCCYWEKSGFSSGRITWFDDDKRLIISNLFYHQGAPIRRVKRTKEYYN